MSQTRVTKSVAAKRNTEEESSDGSQNLRLSKRKRVAVEVQEHTTEHENESPSQPGSQIEAFRTEDELMSYAASRKLTHIKIKDLSAKSDMHKHYVGGWVVGSYASSFSQGHVISIFIRDQSTSDRLTEAKQLMICIDSKIAEELPSMLSSEYKLFIHKGVVSPHMPQYEYSQDLSKCLLVRGEEPRVWIVHKNANKDGFFRQRSCKPAWHQKQKRRRIEKDSPESRSSPEASQNLSGSSSHRFSLPDDFGFPDSAFNVSHTTGDDTSMASTSESSSDENDADQARTAGRAKQGKGYQYKHLSELVPGDRKVNVFGVVKEFTEAKQTRGTDLYSSMILIDESCPLNGVLCLSFSHTDEGLPHVRRAGDIVSLHRVMVEEYQNRLQIINNNFSSWQRISGRVGHSFKVHTVSRSHTFTSADKKRVKQLRLWYQRLSLSYRENLATIQPYRSFGLLCQVVGVLQSNGKDCVLLTVWDGTECSLSLRKRAVAEEDQMVSNHDYMLSALASGFDCQVVISYKGLFNSACSLRLGAMVVINNVIPVECSETFELQTKIESSIEVLHDDDPSYQELETALQIALDTQPTITTIPHQAAPLISTANLQSDGNSPVKAHLRVKILSVATSTLEDMSRLACHSCGLFTRLVAGMSTSEDGHSTNPCSVCLLTGQDLSESPNPRCIYNFQVYVTDLSGAVLKVLVTDKEGARLLHGLPPTNFYQHQEARYKLLQKLNALTGGNPPFSMATSGPRPWIDCCVLKIRYNDEDSYTMFDTALLA